MHVQGELSLMGLYISPGLNIFYPHPDSNLKLSMLKWTVLYGAAW